LPYEQRFRPSLVTSCLMLLGAVTSTNAAMPVAPASGDTSVVLVDRAWGWYRGPDEQCYVMGTSECGNWPTETSRSPHSLYREHVPT
jgi:hypothetical protein